MYGSHFQVRKGFPLRVGKALGTLHTIAFILTSKLGILPSSLRDLEEVATDEDIVKRAGKYGRLLREAGSLIGFLRQSKLERAIVAFDTYLREVKQLSENIRNSAGKSVLALLECQRQGVLPGGLRPLVERSCVPVGGPGSGLMSLWLAGWEGVRRGYVLLHVPFEGILQPLSSNCLLKLRKEAYWELEGKAGGVLGGWLVHIKKGYDLYPLFGRLIRKNGGEMLLKRRLETSELMRILARSYFAGEDAERILTNSAPADFKRMTFIPFIGNAPVLIFCTNAWMKGHLRVGARIKVEIGGASGMGILSLMPLIDGNIKGLKAEGEYALLLAKPLGWTYLSLRGRRINVDPGNIIVLGISQPLDVRKSLTLSSRYPLMQEVAPLRLDVDYGEIEVEELRLRLFFEEGVLVRAIALYRGKEVLIPAVPDRLKWTEYPLTKAQWKFLRALGLPVKRRWQPRNE